VQIEIVGVIVKAASDLNEPPDEQGDETEGGEPATEGQPPK
jgi:hypothetical protein